MPALCWRLIFPPEITREQALRMCKLEGATQIPPIGWRGRVDDENGGTPDKDER